MKEIPESETQVKFFADTCEKRSEILAKHFADFRRKSGRKKFDEKSSTFSTRDEAKFFHSEILGVVGHNNEDPPKSGLRVSVCSLSSLRPMNFPKNLLRLFLRNNLARLKITSEPAFLQK